MDWRLSAFGSFARQHLIDTPEDLMFCLEQARNECPSHCALEPACASADLVVIAVYHDAVQWTEFLGFVMGLEIAIKTPHSQRIREEP